MTMARGWRRSSAARCARWAPVRLRWRPGLLPAVLRRPASRSSLVCCWSCWPGARPGDRGALAPWKEPVMAAGPAAAGLHRACTRCWTTGWTRDACMRSTATRNCWWRRCCWRCCSDARHRLMFLRALMAGAVLLAIVTGRRCSSRAWLHRCWAAAAFRPASRWRSAPSCCCCARAASRGRGRRAALAAFLALTVLFAIDGRTGHVVLLVLASCAAWLHSPPRWRWAGRAGMPAAGGGGGDGVGRRARPHEGNPGRFAARRRRPGTELHRHPHRTAAAGRRPGAPPRRRGRGLCQLRAPSHEQAARGAIRSQAQRHGAPAGALGARRPTRTTNT